MTPREPSDRLHGWRLAAIGTLVLGIAAVNAAGIVSLLSRGTGVLSELPEFMGSWFPLMYLGALAAAAGACVLSSILILRGRGGRASLALALAMVAFTFCLLGMLTVLVPWGAEQAPAGEIAVRVVGFIPLVAVLGTGAFLRFAVLFPQPLSAGDLARLGRVEAPDSLGRLNRAFARIAPPPVGKRLLDRMPRRLRQLAARPVVPDAGRLLTEPRRLWTAVGLAALVPYVLWWAIEVAPPLLGWTVRPSDVQAVIAAAVLMTWLVLVPGGIIVAIAILRLGYGLAEPPDRRRMRWMLESLNSAGWVFLAMGPFFLLESLGVGNPVVAVFPGVFFGLLPLIVVAGFALAVFYQGALEPSLVVRRSTLYGMFGFALAFLFAVVEELVTEHIATRAGLPDGTGTLAASGVIAAVFGSLFGRFNRKVAEYLEPTGAVAPGAERLTTPEPGGDVAG